MDKEIKLYMAMLVNKRQLEITKKLSEKQITDNNRLDKIENEIKLIDKVINYLDSL